jgi:hypothetical protein
MGSELPDGMFSYQPPIFGIYVLEGFRLKKYNLFYILWSFALFYVWKFGIFLVIFSEFWFVASRKFWQPCMGYLLKCTEILIPRREDYNVASTT